MQVKHQGFQIIIPLLFGLKIRILSIRSGSISMKKKLASVFISLTAIKGYSHYTFINEIENIKEQTTIVLRQINSQN